MADGSITGSGVTITAVEPGGIWLVSGIVIAPNSVDAGRLWLAPDRVLVVADTAPDGAPVGAFVSDVTDGFVVLDVIGANWTALLSMATTLPPEALAPGHCAQTVFAGLSLLLAGCDGGIRIFVERPHAAWLLDWFQQAVTSLA